MAHHSSTAAQHCCNSLLNLLCSSSAGQSLLLVIINTADHIKSSWSAQQTLLCSLTTTQEPTYIHKSSLLLPSCMNWVKYLFSHASKHQTHTGYYHYILHFASAQLSCHHVVWCSKIMPTHQEICSSKYQGSVQVIKIMFLLIIHIKGLHMSTGLSII